MLALIVNQTHNQIQAHNRAKKNKKEILNKNKSLRKDRRRGTSDKKKNLQCSLLNNLYPFTNIDSNFFN